MPTNVSWGWCKLLGMREVLRGQFVHIIGNGVHTSAWFDDWSGKGPLINIVRRRDIIQADLRLSDSVADIVLNDVWLWPSDWVDRFTVLANLAPLSFSNNMDVVKWKDLNGIPCEFSIAHVWEYLRPRASQKTQDMLKTWEIRDVNGITCPLCNKVPDSHDHLFFTCSYAAQVWSLVVRHFDFPINCYGWRDFMLLLSPFANRNIARFVVIKLLFAASVYFVWHERNRKVFKKGHRSPAQVYETIYSTVV
ncbi:uncharacterized protein [Rutidosis leptorrhynchoides]|uniref:uncharacterized protein n=1 Tax=Rutidosis leptorrhynchoides TaxID=125765 RepID=UPI003A99BC04